MRVAYWRDGGEPRPTRIAIIAPCHRFRQAGINAFAVGVCRSLLTGFPGYLRFSLEPIVEVAPWLSSFRVPDVSKNLAGRAIHRRCAVTVNRTQVHRFSAPHSSESVPVSTSTRSLLHNLCANRPSP